MKLGPRTEDILLTLKLLPKHGQEDGEVDGPTGFLHHGIEFLILHIETA